MLGHRIRETHNIGHSLRLTEAERVAVESHSLSLRLALIQALHGDRYEPRATCPQCSRKLTPVEIIRGFNTDPTDFTTCCTACGFRFEPELVCFSDGSEIHLPFYCESQTLAQLPGKETLPPEQFAREHPAIYRSAIVHHGGVRQAFAKLDLAYPFEEIEDWKNKVLPFLGRLPDTIIAECADVSVYAVRMLRRKHGVERYTLQTALAEADVDSDATD